MLRGIFASNTELQMESFKVSDRMVLCRRRGADQHCNDRSLRTSAHTRRQRSHHQQLGFTG